MIRLNHIYDEIKQFTEEAGVNSYYMMIVHYISEDDIDIFHLKPENIFLLNINDYGEDDDYLIFYYGDDDLYYIDLEKVSRIQFRKAKTYRGD